MARDDEETEAPTTASDEARTEAAAGGPEPARLGTREQQMAGVRWLVGAFGDIEARFARLKPDEIVVLDVRADRGRDLPDDAPKVVAAATKHSRKPLNKLVRHFEGLGFPRSYAAPRLKEIFALEPMKGAPALVVCVGDTTEENHRADFEHSITATTVQAVLRRRADLRAAAALRQNGVQGQPDAGGDPSDNYRSRNKCGHCGRPCGTLCCAACGQVRYCDRRCQKAHWPAHKGPCAKRRAAVARIDELRKQMGCMTTGHDTIKRMSDAGVAAMMTKAQSDDFMRKCEEFRKKFVASGLLADFIYEVRGKKMMVFADGRLCGDDAATVKRKGLAWERKISVHLDHGDYLDFVARYARRGRDGGAATANSFVVIDDSEVPALVRMGKINKTVSKMLMDTFSRVDPKDDFLCVLSDRNLGPFADATMIVPWRTREKVRGAAWREPRARRAGDEHAMARRLLEAAGGDAALAARRALAESG